MKKALSLTLYIVGVLLLIAAAKIPGSSAAPVAIILAIAGGIVFAVAWIDALIRTAQLGLWGWFVLLLLFSVVSLLISILWGPTPDKLADLAAENM